MGPEFRVNTFTPDYQRAPAVAVDAAGNFVVAWVSYGQDGSYAGVFAQRFAGTGSPLGGEFRVNSYITNSQTMPSVASDAAGNFVVVWMGQYPFSQFQVFAQRFAGTGAPLGGEFRVNTSTTTTHRLPSVTSGAAGNFVVAWEGGGDGSGYAVFAQRYASTGAPLGGQFRVNTFTFADQQYVSVAADPAGNFVVAWTSEAQDGSSDGIFAQRYASTGAPLGGEFQVNTHTLSSEFYPAVAASPAGDFVIVWRSSGQDGSGHGVFAQRYASTGAPLGGEFQVNTYTTGDQSFAVVAIDLAGNFVVAWQSRGQDGSFEGVYAQRYASSGAPIGGEFRVNTFTFSYQAIPSVGADPAGNFVILWGSHLQDGFGAGVYGQRYNMIVPVELMRFGVE
jgi:hypothetical protein